MEFLKIDSFLNKYFNPISDCHIQNRIIDFLSKEEFGSIEYVIARNFLPFPRYYYIKIPYKCLIENENDFNCRRDTNVDKNEDRLIIHRNVITKQYKTKKIVLKFSRQVNINQMKKIIKIHEIPNLYELQDFEGLKAIQISNNSSITIQNFIFKKTFIIPHFSDLNHVIVKILPEFNNEFSIVSKGSFGKISKEKGNIITLKNIIELEWIIDLKPYETKKFDIFLKIKI